MNMVLAQCLTHSNIQRYFTEQGGDCIRGSMACYATDSTEVTETRIRKS